MGKEANNKKAWDGIDGRMTASLLDHQDEDCPRAADDVPVLHTLAVTGGALVGAAPGYWTVVDDIAPVTITATTLPPDAEGVQWVSGLAGGMPNTRTLSRALAGQFIVSARLNTPFRTVHIDVYDVLSLVSDLPLPFAGTTRKGYAGYLPNNRITLTVGVAPEAAAPAALARLIWSEGNPGANANERIVDGSLPFDRTVSARIGHPSIGARQQRVRLRVCQWPRLEVRELTFSGGHVIENDTVGGFDRDWRFGRVNEVDSSKFNPPQCYTRATRITLSARLAVTVPPTDTETVTVRATCTLGGVTMSWASGPVAVTPGAASVSLALGAADLALPDAVAYYPAARIDWSMSDPNGGTIALSATTHAIYVTLGNPVDPNAVYWTLLHYSCQNAAGANAAAALADRAFDSYTGRDMQRKRDGKPMTYWNPRSVAKGNSNTMKLLGSSTHRQLDSSNATGLPDASQPAVATGHCGAWAESFIDMLKIHGLASGHKVNVTNSTSVAGIPQGGFMVATWHFATPPAVDAHALTHALWSANCHPVANGYAPGQNNPTPPPAFKNHFVVWCTTNDTLYDPSYGQRFAGAPVTQVLHAWELHSISGLYSSTGAKPDAGYATAAVPAPGRRLQFQLVLTGAYLG